MRTLLLMAILLTAVSCDDGGSSSSDAMDDAGSDVAIDSSGDASVFAQESEICTELQCPIVNGDEYCQVTQNVECAEGLRCNWHQFPADRSDNGTCHPTETENDRRGTRCYSDADCVSDQVCWLAYTTPHCDNRQDIGLCTRDEECSSSHECVLPFDGADTLVCRPRD